MWGTFSTMATIIIERWLKLMMNSSNQIINNSCQLRIHNGSSTEMSYILGSLCSGLLKSFCRLTVSTPLVLRNKCLDLANLSTKWSIIWSYRGSHLTRDLSNLWAPIIVAQSSQIRSLQCREAPHPSLSRFSQQSHLNQRSKLSSNGVVALWI